MNTIPFMATDETDERIVPKRYYLLEWRTDRGWTQAQLGELIRADKGVVSSLENGKRKFTHNWRERYAEAFGVSEDAFSRHPSRPSIDAMLVDMPADVRDLIEASVVSMIERYKSR